MQNNRKQQQAYNLTNKLCHQSMMRGVPFISFVANCTCLKKVLANYRPVTEFHRDDTVLSSAQPCIGTKFHQLS